MHPMSLRHYNLTLGLRGTNVQQQVDLSGHTLILSADHPDKAAYPTRTFEVKAAGLTDILVGEVVWVGRYLGSGRRR